MKKFWRFLPPILAVVLTVIATYRLLHGPISYSQLRDLIRTFPILILLELAVIATVMYLVRAFRFFLLLRDSEIKISLFGAIKVYISGQALSPLPAGESARAILVKLETGRSPKTTITPLLLLGVTEMMAAVLITTLGSIFLGVLRLAATIALVGTLGLAWLLINHKVVELAISQAPQDSKIKRAGRAIIKKQKEVKSAVLAHRSWAPKPLLVQNILLSIVTDLLGGLLVFVIGRYYHLSLSFLWSFYVFAATTVLGELIPFAPGGIGVTEGGMIGVLLISGATLGPSLAVVVVFRAVTLVYGFLLGVVALSAFYAKSYLASVAHPHPKPKA